MEHRWTRVAPSKCNAMKTTHLRLYQDTIDFKLWHGAIPISSLLPTTFIAERAKLILNLFVLA